ncbi:MAG: hypothetical protein PHW53_02650 [Patescibacteria group bacterium]|nr:hypothetical protein [Patescibacteria group bacterium]
MDKINPSMPGEAKNMSAVWIIVAIVIVAVALGGLMYYFQTLSQEKFVAQEQAINDLREELGQPTVVAEEGVEEEGSAEEEYLTFESEPVSVLPEIFSFEYAKGWHIYHEYDHGWGEEKEISKILVSPDPLQIALDAEYLPQVYILVDFDSVDTLDEFVDRKYGDSVETSEDVIIANYPGKKIHVVDDKISGEDIEVYAFVSPNAAYSIYIYYPGIKQASIDLPAEYQRIIDSFKIESGS